MAKKLICKMPNKTESRFSSYHTNAQFLQEIVHPDINSSSKVLFHQKKKDGCGTRKSPVPSYPTFVRGLGGHVHDMVYLGD